MKVFFCVGLDAAGRHDAKTYNAIIQAKTQTEAGELFSRQCLPDTENGFKIWIKDLTDRKEDTARVLHAEVHG